MAINCQKQIKSGKRNNLSKLPVEEVSSSSAVSLNKKGQIALRIYATPGAKRSAITGMDQHNISITLAAPPRDGQANQELLEFVGECLKLRKAELDFDKGSRSRTKILLVTTERFTIKDIETRIEECINS